MTVCVFLSSFGAFPVLLEFRPSSSDPASSACIVFYCFSPVLVISTPPPGLPSAVLGLGSVLGVATAPAVPAVAPTLFCHCVSALRFPLAAVPAAPSSLPLRFSACCGYGCSFQSSSTFPHAAAPAAPFAFGAAPAVFLDEGSPDAVPRGPIAALPCVYA